MTSGTLLSMPEVESLCLKAARGAGLSWGQAEEAGMAARWLAARGLPGPEWLLECLSAPRTPSLHIRGRDWQAEGPLCPIVAGAALSDHAILPQGPGAGPLTLCNVRAPALLVPFVAGAAAALGQSLALNWPGAQVEVDADGSLVWQGDLAAQTADVTVGLRAAPGLAAGSLQATHRIAPAVQAALETLMLATTVPASDLSRAGAGAAGSDND
jgi:hypothetical protein